MLRSIPLSDSFESVDTPPVPIDFGELSYPTLHRVAAFVAHDFNNLFSIITGSLAALASELRSGTFNGDPHDLINNALSASHEGAALIGKFAACAGHRPQTIVPTRVNELVDELAEMIAPTLPEMGEIKTNLASTELVVNVDPVQLEISILALATNAFEAMTNSHLLTLTTISLEVSADEPVGTLSPGTYAVIRINDTGVGMDTETLERAYLPFFTTKSSDTNRGFGLSMAYGFARQAGGTMRIASRLGTGSQVEIILPCTVLKAE